MQFLDLPSEARSAPCDSTELAARRHLLRFLLIAGLAIFLAGCTMLGLVYERLDTLVGFYIEDLVDLTPEQSAQLDRTLAGNLQWHRESELQRYAGFLREFAGTVDAGLEGAHMLEASRRAEAYWRDIFVQAAPGYSALALTFTDAQVEQLIAGLERKDDEDYEEYADRNAAQRAALREKSVRKFLERFTGPLSEPQRALVREHAARVPSIQEEWRVTRQRWRASLEETLRARTETPEFHARMLQLIARPDELWTPQYRSTIDASRDSFIGLVVELDATLTPAQRAATKRELLELASAVEKLLRV
jgi:hypothetical protein